MADAPEKPPKAEKIKPAAPPPPVKAPEKPPKAEKLSVEERLDRLEKIAAETRADQVLIVNEIGRLFGEPVKSNLAHIISTNSAPAHRAEKKG